MYKTIVSIDGMMRAMCEAHINNAVRNSLKKVRSSHKKGETVIISEETIAAEEIEKALDGSGYKVLSVSCEVNKKSGLLDNNIRVTVYRLSPFLKSGDRLLFCAKILTFTKECDIIIKELVNANRM